MAIANCNTSREEAFHTIMAKFYLRLTEGFQVARLDLCWYSARLCRTQTKIDGPGGIRGAYGGAYGGVWGACPPSTAYVSRMEDDYELGVMMAWGACPPDPPSFCPPFVLSPLRFVLPFVLSSPSFCFRLLLVSRSSSLSFGGFPGWKHWRRRGVETTGCLQGGLFRWLHRRDAEILEP